MWVVVSSRAHRKLTFEVTRALNIGQNERIQVHGRLIAMIGQYIVLFTSLSRLMAI